MTPAWASSSADLALDISAGVGRRAALEAALRDGIRSGRLPAGAVLPSSRALAADLGVARGTVSAAYDQLASEGWLVTRPGAGTAVATGSWSPDPIEQPTDHIEGVRHDFHPGLPGLDGFPRQAWTAAVRQALTERVDGDIGGDLRGHPELRVRLLEYLARARRVVGDPDGLIISNGVTQGLALVATALRHRGVRAVAMEDPCLPRHRDVVAAAGLHVEPVPVDEDGLRVDLIPATVGAVVVTPAHHFPLGVSLAPERFRELVDRATTHDILVVEDDYLAEFWYERRSVGAVQAMAPEHVVYMGSASKALAPGVRLGWMVVPRALRLDITAAKRVADNGTSILDQLVLCELLASGAFQRHVRRQRARYQRRRDHLVAVLRQRVPRLRIHNLAAGLHLLVELPPGSPDEADIITEAARRDIRLVPLAAFWRDRPAPPRTLAVGYAAPPDHGFRTAVDALAQLLADYTKLDGEQGDLACDDVPGRLHRRA